MLEKVNQSKPEGVLCWSNIQPDSVGSGLCYVRGGEHRVSRTDKPFIKLYLQDGFRSVIPGFIFDIDDFKSAGLDLTLVGHQVIKIRYTENYSPRYGMSIVLNKVELVKSPGIDLLATFVGRREDIDRQFERLTEVLKEKTGVRATFPYTLCTFSHMEYGQGEIGGLVDHYLSMVPVLESFTTHLSDDEASQLWGSFVLFIYAHSNYLTACSKSEADINLILQLTSSISKYTKVLRMGDGALEVVHMFFGYQPKDIFVRLVAQASDTVKRACKEINLYKTLPNTREGDAGYGIIKNYTKGT